MATVVVPTPPTGYSWSIAFTADDDGTECFLLSLSNGTETFSAIFYAQEAINNAALSIMDEYSGEAFEDAVVAGDIVFEYED